MKLTPLIQLRVIIFITFMFTCNYIFAQSEDTTKFYKQNISLENSLLPLTGLFQFKPIVFPERLSLISNTPINYYQFEALPGRNQLFENISFEQNKTAEIYTNLGQYEHFNNSIIYKRNNKIALTAGFGLLKQNSVMSAFQPNYQLSFHASVEYAFNSWLSAYVYGQYVTPILNNQNKTIDPLTYMNPMFYQTETGGGLRAKYKNINTDVGLKSIYDTQFNQSNSIKSMNTKVTIGF